MTERVVLVDFLRGTAVILMICYHFFFDLNYYGILHQDFNHDVFWLVSRAIIVTLFLALVGVSLVLASDKSGKFYWTRLAKLLAASMAVSLGSYLMFPQSYIFFGILHFIFLASLIGKFFLRFYVANLALGLGVILFGLWYSHPFFDQSLMQWIGLMTHKPHTEDYVPLFPWFGLVLVGIFLGKLLRSDFPPPPLRGAKGKLAPVIWLGRHSLLIYLIHQPLLLGMLNIFLTR